MHISVVIQHIWNLFEILGWQFFFLMSRFSHLKNFLFGPNTFLEPKAGALAMDARGALLS